MKTNLLFVLAMTMVMPSCDWKAKLADAIDGMAEDSVQVEEPEDLSAIKAEVTQRVADIYAHLTKAMNNYGEEGTDLSLDELYCSDDWRATVAAVYRHDMMLDGIGFFEADYWVMGQDASNVYADNIAVEEILDNDNASVVLDLHNFDSVTKVRVDMVREKGEWMIDDFTDLTHDLDWKAAMNENLAE